MDIHEKEVCFGGESARAVSDMILKLFGGIITKDWNDKEKETFREELHKAVDYYAIDIERPKLGQKGIKEKVFGVPMVALVAVARK